MNRNRIQTNRKRRIKRREGSREEKDRIKMNRNRTTKRRKRSIEYK